MARSKKKENPPPDSPAEIPHANPPLKFPFLPTLAGVIAILGFGALAFGNSIYGAFVFDDTFHITLNPHIKEISWDAMFAPRQITRPLVGLTFALNYAISELKLWPYHAVNLAIHLFAALALFGVVRRTLARRAELSHGPEDHATHGPEARATILGAVIASLWVVHPLQTESVTYIVQRMESMMGLFLLLTLYCAIRGFEARKWLWFPLAVVCSALGMGCKQVMAAAPIMVYVYDALFVSNSFIAPLKRRPVFYALLFSTIAILPALMWNGIGSNSAGFDLKSVSAREYARSQPGVLLYYLRLVAWPRPLCFDYDWQPARTAFDIIPGLVVIGAAGVPTVWALWKRSAWAFLGAWFFVILAPTSSILPIIDLAAERRMYLPLAAVIAAVVLGVFFLIQKFSANARLAASRFALAGAILAILALGYTTYLRNTAYYSGAELWSDVLTTRPNNSRAHNNVGAEYYMKRDLDTAYKHYARAIELKPDYADAHTNIALLLSSRGQKEDSLVHYLEALRLKAPPKVPQEHLKSLVLQDVKRDDATLREHFQARGLPAELGNAHFRIAEVLFDLKRYAESKTEIKHAIEADPKSSQNDYFMGKLMYLEGKLPEACEYFGKAVAKNAKDPDAHNGLGAALDGQQRYSEAAGHFAEAIRLRPDYADAQNNYGAVLHALNQRDKAIEHYKLALQYKPDFPGAHNNLGLALSETGQPQAALAEFAEAIRIDPAYPDAHFNRGNTLASMRQFSEAAESFKEALRLKPGFTMAHEGLKLCEDQLKQPR